MPEAREIIAVIVTVGSFGLIGGYVFTGGHLDSGTGVALVAFTAGALGAVLGFYFGKTNGTQAALATATTALANQALLQSSQRRSGDAPPLPTVQAPVTVTAPPAAT